MDTFERLAPLFEKVDMDSKSMSIVNSYRESLSKLNEKAYAYTAANTNHERYSIFKQAHQMFSNRLLKPFFGRKSRKKIFVKFMDTTELFDPDEITHDNNPIFFGLALTPEMVISDTLFLADWTKHEPSLMQQASQKSFANDNNDYIDIHSIREFYKPYTYFLHFKSENNSKFYRELSTSNNWYVVEISIEQPYAASLFSCELEFSAGKSQQKNCWAIAMTEIKDQEIKRALNDINETLIPNVDNYGNWKIENLNFIKEADGIITHKNNLDHCSNFEVYKTDDANFIKIELYYRSQYATKKKTILFDIGLPLSYIKADELEKKDPKYDALFRMISGLQPDYIFISHWHVDHFRGFTLLQKSCFNLCQSYRTKKCKWICTLPVKGRDYTVLKYYSRLINYLIFNNMITFIGQSGVVIKNSAASDSDKVILYKGTGKTAIKYCNKSSKVEDTNAYGLMLQIGHTLFAGDCMYGNWPPELVNDFKNITQMIIPHHESYIEIPDLNFARAIMIDNRNRKVAIYCSSNIKENYHYNLIKDMKFDTIESTNELHTYKEKYKIQIE